MTTIRSTATATATAVALLLGAPAASAAQITYGPSVKNITITKTGDGGLQVTAPTPVDLAAIDTANPGTVGGAWFVGLGFKTGPEGAGGLFRANDNTAEFKYVAADNDTLVEAISFTQVQDDTRNPKFYFTGTTTSISGDPAFLAAFGPVGTADSGDFVLNDIGVTLTALTGSAGATISAGEKLPGRPVPVSEPASLPLLATAAAFFCLAYCQIRRRQH